MIEQAWSAGEEVLETHRRARLQRKQGRQPRAQLLSTALPSNMTSLSSGACKAALSRGFKLGISLWSGQLSPLCVCTSLNAASNPTVCVYPACIHQNYLQNKLSPIYVAVSVNTSFVLLPAAASSCSHSYSCLYCSPVRSPSEDADACGGQTVTRTHVCTAVLSGTPQKKMQTRVLVRRFRQRCHFACC